MEQPVTSGHLNKKPACCRVLPLAAVIFVFGCIVGGSGVWLYSEFHSEPQKRERPPYDSPEKMAVRFIDNVRGFGEITPEQEKRLEQAYLNYYKIIMAHRQRIRAEITKNQQDFDKVVAEIVPADVFDKWQAQPKPWMRWHKGKGRMQDGSGKGHGPQDMGNQKPPSNDGYKPLAPQSGEDTPPPPPPPGN